MKITPRRLENGCGLKRYGSYLKMEGWSSLLLWMFQKSQGQPPGMYIKPWKNDGINYQLQLSELIPDFWLPINQYHCITVSKKSLGFFGKPWGKTPKFLGGSGGPSVDFLLNSFPPWGWPALSCTICWMKMSYRNGGMSNGVEFYLWWFFPRRKWRKQQRNMKEEVHIYIYFSLSKGKSSDYQPAWIEF